MKQRVYKVIIISEIHLQVQMGRAILTTLFICLTVGRLYSADTGWFWHVTDFHWDFTYWDAQLSCNGEQVQETDVFGNQWCDSPYRLVQETVKGMKDIKPDADFILWTGDSVPHIITTYLSTAKNKDIVKNLTQLFQTQLPSVPIYATFGNHDYHPKDQFPPNGNEIYNATYELWKTWINDESQEKYFRKGGYYTVLASPGIRIVAMNSNMYYSKDKATQNVEDPADQFAWLQETLENSTKANEKVILTGHVPPGYTTPRAVRWMSKHFNEKFVQIIRHHSDVIAAMHFGHEHHDSFRLFFDNHTTPEVALFIAPSVTPWRYQLADGEIEPRHNPGIRLVKFDKTTGAQLDIVQYYADFSQANVNSQFRWVIGYNTTSLYGIPDISPGSLNSVVSRMKDRKSSEFRSFIQWYNTNGSEDFDCDSSCHKTVMCGLQYLEELEFNRCLQQSTNDASSVDATWFALAIGLVLILA